MRGERSNGPVACPFPLSDQPMSVAVVQCLFIYCVCVCACVCTQMRVFVRVDAARHSCMTVGACYSCSFVEGRLVFLLQC